ncbi:Phagocyte signaling-impaired protein [Porphyridium purpureum]|uniref:Phagocyte signaling-impaired protein n=1 Tax=Porphyridium purpureum TaxID=35688 RepID=A0A5J4Z2P1_PORPP|nr:Phagocyte signaling-impaired protein [Porphyridium purpureum]|eukprot:POR1878..scf295_1
MQNAAGTMDADVERRLRPVVDALSALNYKQALRLASKLDEKEIGRAVGGSAKAAGKAGADGLGCQLAARALKAMAFLRMGSRAHADALVHKMLDDPHLREHIDPCAAFHLQVYLRDTRQIGRMLGMFEDLFNRALTAIQALPKSHLAKSSLRIMDTAYATALIYGDSSAAHRIAQRMLKSPLRTSHELLIWYTTVALYMQVTQENVSEKDARLKPLLIAMALKVWTQHPDHMNRAEALRFVVGMLIELQEPGKALQLLSENGDKFKLDSEREEMMLRVNLAAHEHAQVAKSCETLLLKHNVDNWQYWVVLFMCERSVDAIERVVNEACESALARSSRAPFLARILLLFRKREPNTKVVAALLNYLERFGSKAVCGNDVIQFIWLLDREGRAQVQSELEHRVSELGGDETQKGPDDANTGGSHLQRRFNIYFLLRSLQKFADFPLSSDVAQTHLLPQNLVDIYFGGLVPELESTERQTSDSFLLLAVEYLSTPQHGKEVSCSSLTENGDQSSSAVSSNQHALGSVVSSIALLDIGLRYSPFNFDFKLRQIQLLLQLGCARAAYGVWRSLDIKHVQFASMSHWVLAAVSDFGLTRECLELVTDIDSLKDEALRDMPDGIIRSLRAGSLDATADFIRFFRRLMSGTVFKHAQVVHLRSATTAFALHRSSSRDAEVETDRRAAQFILDMTDDVLVLQPGASGAALKRNDDRDCLGIWDPKGPDDERVKYMKSVLNVDIGSAEAEQLASSTLDEDAGAVAGAGGSSCEAISSEAQITLEALLLAHKIAATCILLRPDAKTTATAADDEKSDESMSRMRPWIDTLRVHLDTLVSNDTVARAMHEFASPDAASMNTFEYMRMICEIGDMVMILLEDASSESCANTLNKQVLMLEMSWDKVQEDGAKLRDAATLKRIYMLAEYGILWLAYCLAQMRRLIVKKKGSNAVMEALEHVARIVVKCANSLTELAAGELRLLPERLAQPPNTEQHVIFPPTVRTQRTLNIFSREDESEAERKGMVREPSSAVITLVWTDVLREYERMLQKLQLIAKVAIASLADVKLVSAKSG